MPTELERLLTEVFREDAGQARLVNPDRPAPSVRPQLPTTHRPPGPRPWLLAAAAATVLIVAGAGLVLRSTGDGDPGSTSDTTDRPPADVTSGWDLPPGASEALPPAPIPERGGSDAVWSGTEMILWSGNETGPGVDDTAAFDPATGAWRTLAPSPLAGRHDAGVVWTGEEMIVWGGHQGARSLHDGAAYDPAADRWRTLPDAPVDSGGSITSVWTGEEMIVLGGERSDGGRVSKAAVAYDPEADEWRRLADPLNAEVGPGVIWTGTSVLTTVQIVDPRAPAEDFRLARYDPRTDTWHIDEGARYTSLVGVPDADGTTRTVLAMPYELGAPIDLLDSAGDRIGTLPGHPLDLAGSDTAAEGLWVGEEAVFWIRGIDWVFGDEGSTEAWALNPSSRTWRPLPETMGPRDLGALVAAGDILLAWGGDAPGGVAHRAPTSAPD